MRPHRIALGATARDAMWNPFAFGTQGAPSATLDFVVCPLRGKESGLLFSLDPSAFILSSKGRSL